MSDIFSQQIDLDENGVKSTMFIYLSGLLNSINNLQYKRQYEISLILKNFKQIEHKVKDIMFKILKTYNFFFDIFAKVFWKFIFNLYYIVYDGLYYGTWYW